MIYYHQNNKDWYETWAWPKPDFQIYIEIQGHISSTFKQSFIVDEWNYDYIVSNFDYTKEGFQKATGYQLQTLIKMLFRPDSKVDDQRSK